MSEYTPQPHESRARFIAGSIDLIQRRDGCTLAEAEETAIGEWERWMEWHNVRVRRSVVAEEPEWEYGWHTGSTVSLIGRREQIDEWLMVRGWKLGEGDWGSRIMQRTAAGPWVPVKQEGTDDV